MKQKPQARPQPERRPAVKSPRLAVRLFGFHAVREAWLNPERDIRALYLTEAALKTFEPVLKAASGLARPAPQVVDKALLDKALPPGTVHQGIGLDCGKLEEVGVRDLLIAAESKQRVLFLILDQVTDPHNIGAILRSACAFGADGIILQSRHSPEMDGVLAKTASGAAEHVPIALETNLSRAIEAFQEAGYTVFGLDERGGETLPELKNIPDRIVLVLGAEGPGIRPLVRDHCDRLVRLPTAGPVASLNVSNAAAVALYAFTGAIH